MRATVHQCLFRQTVHQDILCWCKVHAQFRQTFYLKCPQFARGVLTRSVMRATVHRCLFRQTVHHDILCWCKVHAHERCAPYRDSIKCGKKCSCEVREKHIFIETNDIGLSNDP